MSSVAVQIPDRLYFRIGDVADLLQIKPYVLRYWESEFPMISPQKSATGQRVYRRSDVETILLIKTLLYEERYSIEGARKRIGEMKSSGEYKTARKVLVASEAAPVSRRENRERVEKIKTLTKDLRGLLRTPVEKLFE